jgi:hypothetical protein
VPSIVASIPASGAATAPVLSLPGIVGRAVTGTTSTDTIVSTDCNPKRVEYAGTVNVAVTLPTPTSLAVPNCSFKLVNLTASSTVTVTPTTWTVNGAATLALPAGASAIFFVDPNSSTNWATDGPSSTVTSLSASGSISALASLAGWDASQMPGATVDVQVNNCTAYAMTNLGGVCNASLLGLTSGGSAQTLAAQINVNEPLPPALTTVTGGSLGATLTFKVAYTLISAKGESAVSEESTATTDSTCPTSGKCSIQVTAPTYTGSATQYKPKMTAAGGASWTEDDCGLATAVGTNATITSLCSGAGIVKANPTVALILPPSGAWSCTITTGSGYCLKWFDRSYIYGYGAGEGQRFSIIGTGSTSVAAICGSDLNAKGGTAYWNVEGFSCNQGGGATSIAAISMQNFPDNTYGANIDALAQSGVGLLITGGGGGAGSTFVNVHAECSSDSGCIPCQFGTSGSPSPSITIISPACVHPGATKHAIEVRGGGGVLNLIGAYVEGNAIDTSTPLMDIGSIGGAGPVNVVGFSLGKEAAGSTAYLVQIENHAGQVGTLTGLYAAITTNVINDLYSGNVITCTAPCTFAGPYSYGGTGGTGQWNTGIYEAGALTTDRVYTNTQALTTGAATHTFANSFTFTSSATFGCTCTDQTAANACKAVPASATTVTLAGTSSDVLWLSCTGH